MYWMEILMHTCCCWILVVEIVTSQVKPFKTIILEEKICLINPVDFYTYICPTTGRRSCLDLCLATPKIATDIDIKLGADVGSDHCTVEIEICLEPVITDSVGIKRLKGIVA